MCKFMIRYREVAVRWTSTLRRIALALYLYYDHRVSAA